MGEFRDISIEDKIYSPGEILDVLHKVRPHFRFSYTKTALRYFNIPCCFDIETTSFFRSTGIKDDDKTAIMYVWTFGIFGAVIIGRTWEEFIQMLDLLSMELNLNKDKRLLIYCHNLSFEFEFIRKWLKWEKARLKKSYDVEAEYKTLRLPYLIGTAEVSRYKPSEGNIYRIH